MIAFYFGAKSLELMVSPKPKAEPSTAVNPDTDNPGAIPEKTDTGTI